MANKNLLTAGIVRDFRFNTVDAYRAYERGLIAMASQWGSLQP